MHATAEGLTEIVQLLLEHGANPSYNDDGHSALTLAKEKAMTGDRAAIEILKMIESAIAKQNLAEEAETNQAAEHYPAIIDTKAADTDTPNIDDSNEADNASEITSQTSLEAAEDDTPSGSTSLNSSIHNSVDNKEDSTKTNYILPSEQLRILVENNGGFLGKVKGDGNCFYRALAKQLNIVGKTTKDNTPYTHILLRKLAIEEILAHKDVYNNFLGREENTSADEAICQFMLHHAKDGVWTDNIMIQALSNNLGLRINILRSDNAPSEIITPSNGISWLIDIYLGFIPELHYQPYITSDMIDNDPSIVERAKQNKYDEEDNADYSNQQEALRAAEDDSPSKSASLNNSNDDTLKLALEEARVLGVESSLQELLKQDHDTLDSLLQGNNTPENVRLVLQELFTVDKTESNNEVVDALSTPTSLSSADSNSEADPLATMFHELELTGDVAPT
jgi:hypothetical protein